MKLSSQVLVFCSVVKSICAFQFHRGFFPLRHRTTKGSYDNGDSSDPFGYDELLDIDKPLKHENNPLAITESSILSGVGMNATSDKVTFRAKDAITKKAKPNSMEAHLEQQFGGLDEVLEGDEQWVTELRDIVELKRGFAVWSKRSDKEIKKEAKKALASKGVSIPNNVALTINTVFIEKSCTLATFKKEQEMVYTEYKKWMREQKQKMKKDPLPILKVELAKKWLQRPVGTKLTSFPTNSRGKQAAPGLFFRKRPSVVLDELSTILEDLERESGNDDTKNGITSTPTMAVSNAAKSSSLSYIVLSAVSSIQNWNLTAAELRALEGSTDGEFNVISDSLNRRQVLKNARKTAQVNEFMVDDVPMYLPNVLSDEYFVVI